MYSFCKFIEKALKYIRIKVYICFCRIKYGSNFQIGKGVRFGKRFRINMTKKAKLIIGKGTYFNNDCSINVHKLIKIGENNCFGENVKIYDHNHVFNNKSVDMLHTFNSHQIIIGNNNWIGSNTVILSKTSIGNNNVIGAGTIMNYDIEDEYIVKNNNKSIIEKIKYI